MDDDQRQDDGNDTQQPMPLCPNCLTPCDPKQYYCTNCDSNEAINPLTPYISFVNIRFSTGIFIKLWRKCWDKSKLSILARCIYLIVLLIFSPVIVIVGIPFLLIGRISDQKIRNNAEVSLTIFFIVAAFLYFSILVAMVIK